MTIVFSTAWYQFKTKYDYSTYYEWIDNFLSNVHCFYLVIYSDEASSKVLEKYQENPRIQLIILPYTEFHQYRYHQYWIKNYDKNNLLKDCTDWKVNMLWCEKIFFVQRTIQNQYFGENINMYGWCDVGYFRNRNCDLPMELLRDWPNPEKIQSLDTSKIHYALVSRDHSFLRDLELCILDKNEKGLPKNPIIPSQKSIAGGFFICHKNRISWWAETFDTKVQLYFENDYLVKDDQMIIVDCYFNNNESFCLYSENNVLDNWFMFQRILL